MALGALQCRVEEIDGVRVHRKVLLSARGTKSATAPRMRRLWSAIGESNLININVSRFIRSVFDVTAQLIVMSPHAETAGLEVLIGRRVGKLFCHILALTLSRVELRAGQVHT
jgi:hypothetical protein